MTASSDKITDAYAMLRIHSSTLSVEELSQLAGFTPTATMVKGSPLRDRSHAAPANTIFLSTESLVQDKDLNAHIRELGRRLPQGTFASRFASDEVDIYLTIYWWTTEEIGFFIDPDCLGILARVGVSPYFNFLIDPSPINPTVEAV